MFLFHSLSLPLPTAPDEGSLRAAYYAGDYKPASETRSAWAFAAKLDKKEVARVRERVDRLTNGMSLPDIQAERSGRPLPSAVAAAAATATAPVSTYAGHGPSFGPVGPSRGPAAAAAAASSSSGTPASFGSGAGNAYGGGFSSFVSSQNAGPGASRDSFSMGQVATAGLQVPSGVGPARPGPPRR